MSTVALEGPDHELADLPDCLFLLIPFHAFAGATNQKLPHHVARCRTGGLSIDA